MIVSKKEEQLQWNTRFLKKFPKSKFAKEAQKRYEELIAQKEKKNDKKDN